MSNRVLVHADDLGMCHGANVAFTELTASGFLDAGSVMVPCPWFKEIAEIAAADPTLDVGVHLTLNSEKTHYKWRPITRPSPAAGLTDGDGFMWRSVAELRHQVEPEAAALEMRAQLDAALAAGVDVTHADAHMFAALSPELCSEYLQIGVDYAIPVMLTDEFDGMRMPRHLDAVDDGRYRDTLDEARRLGLPVFETLIETAWDPGAPAGEVCAAMFERIDGMTYMALHPTAPGEVEFIEPATAHVRIGEYDTFRDRAFAASVGEIGAERISWRGLRHELRARS